MNSGANQGIVSLKELFLVASCPWIPPELLLGNSHIPFNGFPLWFLRSSTDPITSNDVACAQKLDLKDWRTFRATLVERETGRCIVTQQSPGGPRWAHQITAPEKGCLLLSRHFTLHTDFIYSVILIVGHGTPAPPLFVTSRAAVGEWPRQHSQPSSHSLARASLRLFLFRW